MVSATPAHMMGDTGGAYYYGSTKVGGITNMTTDGNVLRPMMVRNVGGQSNGSVDGPYSMYLGGVGFYDCIANSPNVWMFADGRTGNSRININGELCRNATTTTFLGVSNETFTTAVTVTATNGSTAITFSASIAGATLPGYAYTPNRNAPQAGDIVEIVQGGVSQFYRLVAGAAAAWTIFPAYQGTGGAGLVTTVRRTGFGTSSRLIHFLSGASDVYYYVGNQTNSTFTGTPSGFGTIEANVGGINHFMAPVTTPSASVLNAVDIAYYKSFLLYIAGGAIGWSVAGFPTGGLAGFSTGDFPDLNISVIDTQDSGLAFEFLGDQLIALFQNGAWLVQPTGIVPEFAFYRLSQVPGQYVGRTSANTDAAPFSNVYGRHATRSASSVFFVSEQGLSVIQGAPPATVISTPVANYDWPSATSPVQPGAFNLSWAQGSDTVVWRDTDGRRGLLFRSGNWSQFDLSAIGLVRGTAAADASGYAANDEQGAYRPIGIMYWNPSDQRIYTIPDLDAETTAASLCPWTWASPILTLGQIYAGFKFGGFGIWARAAVGAAVPTSLNWTVYGGFDPYHMNALDNGTFDYATGTIDGRHRIATTLDMPFLGIVLSGSSWIELSGVVAYDSASKAV